MGVQLQNIEQLLELLKRMRQGDNIIDMEIKLLPDGKVSFKYNEFNNYGRCVVGIKIEEGEWK